MVLWVSGWAVKSKMKGMVRKHRDVPPSLFIPAQLTHLGRLVNLMPSRTSSSNTPSSYVTFSVSLRGNTSETVHDGKTDTWFYTAQVCILIKGGPALSREEQGRMSRILHGASTSSTINFLGGPGRPMHGWATVSPLKELRGGLLP